MRYDDRLRTALGTAAAGARAQALKWRQIVDLLAQRAGGLDDDAAAGALRWLRSERASVPIGERLLAARAVAGRRIPLALLTFFAADTPPVAAPVLRGARLPASDWLQILPALGPTARALLRHRDDLPDAVRQALSAFGPVDLVLEGQTSAPEPVRAPEPAPVPLEARGGDQIRGLVARIEAFRRDRDAKGHPRPARPTSGSFRWETDVNGVVVWSDGERGSLVGLPLVGDAARATHGPISARRPFHDLSVQQDAGAFSLSGVPVFTDDGRFAGYRGVGRAAEQAGMSALEPVAVREMVHELKTPLNAISGFAEMIEGEYLGPATAGQRGRADEILRDARRLGDALADIDLAVRAFDEAVADLANVMVDEHPALEARAREAGTRLVLATEPGLPPVALGPEIARRLLARLVEGALRSSDALAELRVSLRRAPGGVQIRLSPGPGRPDDLTAHVIRGLVAQGGGAFLFEDGSWSVSLRSTEAPSRMAI